MSVMHGTESINFSVEKPISSSYLKLKQTVGCNYRSDLSAWEIKDSRGYFEFTIKAGDNGGVGAIEIVLRSCDGVVNGLTNCPITISVNGNSISGYDRHEIYGRLSGKNPRKLNWYDKSFYIPPGLITAGENTVRVQANGGSTVFLLQKVTLSCLMQGSESIDFFLEKPISRSSLKLEQTVGCNYRSDMSAWEIKDSRGYFEFTINLGEKHGVGIVLRSCSSLVNGSTNCPITVSINGNNLITGYDPHQVHWYDKLFYIPPTMMTVGDNTLRVQADGGSTVFFLQKVILSCFQVQPQQQSEWCWAACTVSIATYHNPSITWNQGLLVNAELRQTTCIVNGSTLQCNKPWYFDKALSRTGNLDKLESGTLPIDKIETEIAGMRPIGVCINWGSNHFVVIAGVGATNNVLAIEDPWYGSSVVNYDSFCTKYQGRGKWTHSYLTKK